MRLLSTFIKKELRLYLMHKDTAILLVVLPLVVFLVLYYGTTEKQPEPKIAVYSELSEDLLKDVNKTDYVNATTLSRAIELTKNGNVAVAIAITESENGLDVKLFLDNSVGLDALPAAGRARVIADKVGIAFSSKKLDDMWQNLDNADTSLSESKQELVSIKSDVSKSKTDLEGTLDDLSGEEYAEIEDRIDEQNKTIASMTGTVREVENQTATFRDSSSELDSSIASFEENENEIGKVSDSMNATNSSISQLDAQLQIFSVELLAENQTLESKKTGGPADIEIIQEQAQIAFQLARISAMRAALQNMSSETAELNDTINEIRTGMDETKQSLESASAELSSNTDQMTSRVDEMDAKLEDTQQSFEEIRSKIRNMRQNVDSTRDMISQSIQMLEDVTGTVEVSEANIDDFHQKLVDAKSGGSKSYTDILSVENEDLFGEFSLRGRTFLTVALLSVFFGCILVSSIIGVRERSTGVYARLMHSGAGSFEIAIGKLIGDLAATSLIPIILVVLSRYVLGVSMVAPMYQIIGVCVFAVAVFVSMGAIISLFSDSQASAVLICLVVGLPSVMLSGVTIPLSAMPFSISNFAFLLPLTDFYAALKDLVIKGYLTTLSRAGLFFMTYLVFLMQAFYILLFRNLESK